MKTIRKNVFETNSSSTHSITIEHNGENPDYKPLVTENSLFPNRIDQYCIDLENGETGYILSCDTKDKKAALVCHWIVSRAADNYSNNEQDKKDAEIEHWYDYLTEVLGYDYIELASGNFYPNCEYDEVYFSEYYDEGNIDKIIDVILDDSKRIVDKDMPW